jgi:hypothetical protein
MSARSHSPTRVLQPGRATEPDGYSFALYRERSTRASWLAVGGVVIVLGGVILLNRSCGG